MSKQLGWQQLKLYLLASVPGTYQQFPQYFCHEEPCNATEIRHRQQQYAACTVNKTKVGAVIVYILKLVNIIKLCYLLRLYCKPRN